MKTNEDQTMTNYWRIFGFFFFFGLVFLPFQPALNISTDIDLASIRILIIGFFLFWLAGMALDQRKSIKIDFIGLGLIGFLLINGLSLFFAGELDWGWRKLLFLASIFPLYFIVADLAADQSKRKKTIQILIGIAIASALIAGAQFLAQFFIGGARLAQIYAQKIGPFFWGQSFSTLVQNNPSWFVASGSGALMRAFGLFPDPHMLAFFLGLVAPIVLARALFYSGSRLDYLIFTGLALTVFLSFSRGGYLALIASCVAVGLVAWPNLGQYKKQLIFGACALAIFLVFILGQPIIYRFISSFLMNEGSSTERLQIWQESFRVFLSQPIFGVGLGNYAKAVEPLAPYRSPITSHNLYLDIASETGIFGLIAWLTLMLVALWLVIKRSRTDLKSGSQLAVLKIGLAGALIYFFVHSIFETAMFNPVVLAELMIIFGLASATLKTNSKIQTPNSK